MSWRVPSQRTEIKVPSLWAVLVWSYCMSETSVTLFYDEKKALEAFYDERAKLFDGYTDDEIQDMIDAGDAEDDVRWVWIRGDNDYGVTMWKEPIRDFQKCPNLFDKEVMAL